MRGSGQLLYGSDFPFTPARGVELQIAAVNAAAWPVEGATWQSLTLGNAVQLLPRMNPPSAAWPIPAPVEVRFSNQPPPP